MNIRLLSDQGESEYLNTPSSGRGTGEIIITKSQIVETLKPIALRKPMAMIVGSVATQGQSNNDIDIVIRGEDFSDKIKEAISFRLYRYFSDILKCSYDDTPKYVHLHYNNAGSYTSYIPLYELSLVPLTNREVVHMNAIPVNITGNFHILEKSKDSNNPHIIAGYASVIEVDEQNQLIPKSTLENGIQTLLKDSEYANLMLVHKNIQVGKILPGYDTLKTHVDDKGLFIVAEIRKDLEIANKLWECITKGDLNSFSIAGEVLLSHDECDDKKCVKVIDKLNIFEISVCSAPVNTNSGFVIVSKSHDKADKVCQDVINTKENKGMVETKEIKKDEPCKDCTPAEPSSNPPVQKEVSVKDAIDSINRELTALKGILNELKAAPKVPTEGGGDDAEDINEPPEKPGEKPDAEDQNEAPEGPGSDAADQNKYPLPKKAEDMVNLSEYTDFVAQFLKENPGKTAADAAAAWKQKKGAPAGKPAAPAAPPAAPAAPSDYPYPAKKDFDELKKSFDSLISTLAKDKKISEMEVVLKSKDDELKNVMKRIETLEKTEVTPKTTVEVKGNVVEEEKSFIMDKEGNLTKPFEGTFKSESKDMPVVRDLIDRGSFYKDPDFQ
jgi:HK97 family phage prohead protease